MERFENPFAAWMLLFFYQALIWWSSGQESLSLPLPDIPAGDKVGHFAAYAIMASLAWSAGAGWSVGSRMILSIAYPTLFGIADEIHQDIGGVRTGSVLDIMADVGGAFFATWLLYSAYQIDNAPPKPLPKLESDEEPPEGGAPSGAKVA
jgi:VanZ family protein